VASTAITASLTMSVVTRNWSAERKRGSWNTGSILAAQGSRPVVRGPGTKNAQGLKGQWLMVDGLRVDGMIRG
jgi:hypothetical protein